MNFDEYLISKKIDGEAFSKADPVLFEQWKDEFEQMHANSFTVQKLNLINPIRRKYQLKSNPPSEDVSSPVERLTPDTPATTTGSAAPRVARPVYKPKIN
ncbi:MAG TPA: hypothetical protein VGD40_02980 [Chryseosolibacter sp.]